MNRKEAEDYIYKSYLKAEKHQDYNMNDSGKRRPDLTRDIIRSKAGTPCVVITGSKGKGSVANMISQILQTEMSVGLMTSPHLVDFCERFKVNGKNISDDDFAKFMGAIQPDIDKIDAEIPENVCISPMGIQAALGLDFFKAKETDFNVIECGKGARYDDVNNVVHEYAVINSIFLEHIRELGETLKEIAEDKSYVINGGQKCVYVAEQSPEVNDVIKSRAREFSTNVKFYGTDFRTENIQYTDSGMQFDVVVGEHIYRDIVVPLMGVHQAKNCALAMALCTDVLKGFNIDSVKCKLKEIDWPGRMEVLGTDPFIMLDACINSVSCRNVIDVLEHMNIKKVSVIIGIPDDKDFAGVAREMCGVASKIILTKSDNPHYIFTPMQQEKLKNDGIESIWTESLKQAIEIAKGEKDPIVILGTTSVVSEVKRMNL